jgi:hypothetical protein
MRHLVRYLSSPAGLWVTSFVAAYLVWYVVRRVTSNEYTIRNVPVEVLTAEGWHLAGRASSVPSVDITFRGAPEDLRLLHRDTIGVVCDARAHTSTDPLEVDTGRLQVHALRGVRKTGIRPAKVTISLLPGE